MKVEVVYALPDSQTLLEVELMPGASVREAIMQSGIVDLHPEIDLERNRVGIFGRRVDPGRTLGDGDRVEIYRPLLLDPKDARRLRAAAKKSSGKAQEPSGSTGGPRVRVRAGKD